MNDDSLPVPGSENPEKHTGLRKGKPIKTAAGVHGVVHSVRHVIGEAGIARGMKALGKLNQKNGFTCPSCAWPDPDDERSGLGEYCENGAKAIAEEATLKIIGKDFFRKNPVNELSKLTDFQIGKMGRIAEPLYLPAGGSHYLPISWEDAFEKVSSHLNSLSSPDEAIFYTSGRTSNEAAFLYQLFVREFGTNNLPDCSNMCHESSGIALTESLGIGKGSVKLEDFYIADVIVIIGQNPGTNHPRMLSALQKAKSNGTKIISINPLPEAGLMRFNNPQKIKGWLGWDNQLTDLYLPVRLNGDMALLQAIEKKLWEAEQNEPGEVFDRDFIWEKCEGYPGFIKHLEQLDLTRLVKESGIEETLLKEAVSILKNKQKIIICWAMGLTQHKNAVDTIKEVVNLLLLKGSIGKPGAGTCPVRGHSNVQGDRTMGIYEKPSADFLESIRNNFHFEPPAKYGFDVVESIIAMQQGKARVFIGLGGNFLSATPDTNYTARAIQKCDLTVQVSTKLNRSHLIHGKESLILPCLARSDKDIINKEEQFVSCENSMGIVHSSKGVLKPVSDKLLSEPAIVCRMAKAVMGDRTRVKWDKYLEHYDHIREEIEKTIPGFDNFNKRVRIPGGFYLPNCNRDGNFSTDSGKAKFNIAFSSPLKFKPGELVMMTIRSHDQFNTTIYGLDDRYRGIYNERRVILINESDMKEQNLDSGEAVDIINCDENIERVAHNFILVPYPIPKGCVATYFPEANVLVPINSVAERSNTPVSKSVIVKLKRRLSEEGK